MYYSAKEAASLVARYVDMSWPNNRDQLFELLTLVNDRIWSEGSWQGMSKEFYVRTRCGPVGEKYIVPPIGYDILLAVNLDGTPSLSRDKWIQFHKNGNGSIDKSCNWADTAVDLGEFPTINDIFCERAACLRPLPITIGAATLGAENEVPTVRVTGEWDRSGPVYTYKKEEFDKRKIIAVNEEPKHETVYGAELAIDMNIRRIENIFWRSISAIHKPVTVNPVEVFAFHSDGTIQLLTRIEPHQTVAKNRRYLVPQQCSTNVVHAMFKISEPEEIVADTQPIYSRNREALISLAIGLNLLYSKKNPAEASPFILGGLKALDDKTRESSSRDSQPIQVVTDAYFEEEEPYFYNLNT